MSEIKNLFRGFILYTSFLNSCVRALLTIILSGTVTDRLMDSLLPNQIEMSLIALWRHYVLTVCPEELQGIQLSQYIFK